MIPHEYAILGGVNRSRVGRIIGSIAGGISSLLVFAILYFFDVAKGFGLNENIPPIAFSLISAAAVYAALYLFFSRIAWKWSYFPRLLRNPNLSGSYDVSGQTLDRSSKILHEWSGEMVISQSWDNIRVRLQTGQSRSHSIAAALHWDETDGYRLLYHYRNEPGIGNKLAVHRGFSDILFSSDQKSASGEYFNGQGRFTFGRMTLTKRAVESGNQ